LGTIIVIDPGPKAIEDLRRKVLVEGVRDISCIYDFLRVTIIGADIGECVRIQNAISDSVDLYESFAPLTDVERTLSNGKVVPEISDFGNEQSAPELTDMVKSGRSFAKTLRFQVGPRSIGHEYFSFEDSPNVLRYNPPPGLRVSAIIMSPDIFEFISDPQSPAHHSRYEARTRESRRLF